MLPKKVREAAERADTLHSELYGKTGEPAPVTAPTQPVPPTEPTQPAPETQEVPPVTPPVQTDNWEDKYRVLNGKYQAEVPRMAAEIRGLKETVQELRDELAAAKTAPPTPAPVAEGMTPAQVVEQFGEDFAKAVGAIASHIADERTSKVREEFKPQLETVQKSSQETARAAFMRELAALVPDWQQIDTDDGFTTYLDEVDELSGRSRRHFFQEADKHNDAQRIARFFKAFKGNSTASAQPTAPATKPEIEALIQPATNRTTEVPKGKRMWDSAGIRQFYVDVRRGRYTPQEAHRIESDIFAAQRENRIAA